MKYFSLFSGIGGFELGIEQSYVETTSGKKNGKSKNDSATDDENGKGLVAEEGQKTRTERRRSGKHPDLGAELRPPTCVGFSEIDKYATTIYQKHFTNHKNYGDITKIDAGTLPDFDLLVGGFPCQSFSIAGKRKGFEDTRGTLFFDIARILQAKRPRRILLENVKGLLSHDNGNTFKTIISTLAELGYDLQWQVLNSKNFGVPQNRERVFIVGHLRETGRPEVFPFGGTNEKDIRNAGEDLSYAIDANYAEGTNTLEKGRRQLVQLNKPTHSNDRIYDSSGISPTLNTMQGGVRQPKIIGGLQGHQTPREDGIAPTLTQAMGQGGGQTPIVWGEDIKIRRLTPKECERLQGFPDGWTEGVSDTQRYKCLGNAVTVNVIKSIADKLLLDTYNG